MISGLYFGSTLLSVIWLPACGLAATASVIAYSSWRGADRETIVDRLAVVWLIAAIGGVLLLTLQPGSNGIAEPRSSIFNPLSPIAQQDAIANVLLYLPVGFFATLGWRASPKPVARTVALCLGLSLGVELTQWVAPIDRAATTHDVMFNVLGGFVGAVAGAFVAHAAHRLSRAANTSER